MRDLILAHGNHVSAVDQNVCCLHHGIAEKTVVGEIAIREFFLLVFIRRHALEPSHRGDHAQQQRELRVLEDSRLDENRRARRIDSDGEPVDEHFPNAFLDAFRRFVMRGQRMPIGCEIQAFVLLLQA